MIVTGGENVWPQPVEQVLLGTPGVADVAVVGADDPDWGQRVVAFVVPPDPQAPPTLEQLRAHAKTRLPAFCAPRELRLVAAIPRTALGKPRRADLAAAHPNVDPGRPRGAGGPVCACMTIRSGGCTTVGGGANRCARA